MQGQSEELTALVKNPNQIFMSMLRRLKFPHNETTLGVFIPPWLDAAIKTYYKSLYGGLRLDEYLQKMCCDEKTGTFKAKDSIYPPET